jgi:acetyl esterase/lipase
MFAQGEATPAPVWDIPYGPHPDQRLDLFVPARPTRAPFALFIHGGGWSVGDKEQYAAVGMRLAEEGVVTAIANYQLSPGAQHPTHAEDVARAVAWCYHHAPDYGADAARFCLMGHSSGAHLAALVMLDRTYLAAHGLDPSLIRGFVGVAGVAYDLDESYATPMLTPFFAPVFGNDCSRWSQAAPSRYVTPSAPTCLLIHGLSDTEAPPATTETFAASLREAGVPAELALLPGEGHISVMFAAGSLVVDFLKATRPAPAMAGGGSE